MSILRDLLVMAYNVGHSHAAQRLDVASNRERVATALLSLVETVDPGDLARTWEQAGLLVAGQAGHVLGSMASAKCPLCGELCADETALVTTHRCPR